MDSQTTIEILSYDPSWPVLYQAECDAVIASLGDELVRVSHIGSTSVPGLAAKPVVDLQAEVSILNPPAFYDEALAEHGYESLDSHENDLRVAMRKRREVSANLHVVLAGSWAAQRTILFRDALRADPALVVRYAALKRAVAAESAILDDYTHAKTAFIEQVIESQARIAGIAYSPGNKR